MFSVALGLLVQGKSDFDAIENYRGDTFFKQSLGIELLPSSATLRQRLDAQASALFEHLPVLTEALLSNARPDYGVLPRGWLPLDIDTFAMDNGGTTKEGVGISRRGRLLPAGSLPRMSASGSWVAGRRRISSRRADVTVHVDALPVQHRCSRCAPRTRIGPVIPGEVGQMITRFGRAFRPCLQAAPAGAQ